MFICSINSILQIKGPLVQKSKVALFGEKKPFVRWQCIFGVSFHSFFELGWNCIFGDKDTMIRCSQRYSKYVQSTAFAKHMMIAKEESKRPKDIQMTNIHCLF